MKTTNKDRNRRHKWKIPYVFFSSLCLVIKFRLKARIVKTQISRTDVVRRRSYPILFYGNFVRYRGTIWTAQSISVCY